MPQVIGDPRSVHASWLFQAICLMVLTACVDGSMGGEYVAMRHECFAGRIASMVNVTFTENIQRHVACPPDTVGGQTVREVLDAVFRRNEKARGYVLDDRGALRKHMIVFVNGQPIADRAGLSDLVPDGADVYVMQALSGG